jgi:hypothetical protein
VSKTHPLMIVDEARKSPVVAAKEAELLSSLDAVAKTLLPVCELKFRARGDVPVLVSINGPATPAVFRSIAKMMVMNADILEEDQ